MNAKVNEEIKRRRIELGLTDAEIAKQVGLSRREYFDIELHADEIYTVTHLSTIKEICEVLKFDLLKLFDIECVFYEKDKQYGGDHSIPRNELLRKKRVEKGISQKELADRLGFYDVEVQNLEEYPDHLETWPIEHISNLAKEVNIPLPILLYVKCAKVHEQEREE